MELRAGSLSKQTALTLVLVAGGDRDDGVLDVFVLVHLRLVERLVEVGRIIILVADSDPDVFVYWNENREMRKILNSAADGNEVPIRL